MRLWLSCGLITAALACGDADSNASHGQFPPATVETIHVEGVAFSQTLELVGQLAADEAIVVKPETAGIVQAIAFSEGQRVREGETLFTLRNAEQRAALREARAVLALASDELARTEKLSKFEVAAEAELDRARASVDAARARRDLAQVELGRMEIKAPFEGVLGARQVSPGDRVDSDTDLVSLAAVEQLKLEFTLPEVSIGVARMGMPVWIRSVAFPDERFAGEVYFVSPILDPDNRRLELKARVGNEDARLRPGMFVRIELEVEQFAGALMVPESAISFNANGPYVWQVGAESSVEQVPVELGDRQDGLVRVTNGLTPGIEIVSAGAHKLFPGAKVNSAAVDVAAEKP